MITILFGICGSGKTHLRINNRMLARASVADIADAYRIMPGRSWYSAVDWVVRVTAHHIQSGYDVVIEGLFLPGTPSRDRLETKLRGIDTDVKWIQVHAPFQTCKARIISREQDNEKICLAILDTYWHRAEAAYNQS